MTKEECFFLGVLSDHLAQKETTPQYNLDWNKIIRLAQVHQVGGIVFHQCKNFIPDNIMSLFNKHYIVSIYNYTNYSAEQKKIGHTFYEHGIEMFAVKGLEIARYYPVPALRTMGDLDIIVRKNKRKEADAILQQLNYKSLSHRQDKEWEYYKRDIMIELHDCLVYDQVINKDEIEKFFNKCWAYVVDGKLDVNFHFLFLFEHLRRHLLNSGAGFRQFMDIAMMSKVEIGLNWEWIIEKLSDLGLLEFSSVCSALIQRWFGIKIPIEQKNIKEEFFEDATDKIFSNGVFGFDNTENKVNAAVNAARNSRVKVIGMLKGALRYVFPSYIDLSDKKFYPYLIGRPYLLPVSWIHRFVRGIRNFGRAKGKMRLKFASTETIRKRDKYLKEWKI